MIKIKAFNNSKMVLFLYAFLFLCCWDTAAADESKLYLLEDAENGRYYPLLITAGGLGFAIKCNSLNEETRVLEGLGFVMDSSVLPKVTPMDPLVVAAKPQDQPFLCPKSEENEISLYQFNGIYYLLFRSSNPSNIYIASCGTLITALGLTVEEAINSDPTPFFRTAHAISCFRGGPVDENPKNFTEWCTRNNLTTPQKDVVKLLLNITPQGSAGFGNANKCKKSEDFLMTLKVINLSNRSVIDISPLNSLTKASELILSNNQISDITPLSELRELTALNLSQNSITNLYPLATLDKLHELNLGKNQISDTRALSSLSSLEALNLSKNKISDRQLEDLTYLRALKSLDLSSNQIYNPKALQSMGTLEKLDLSYNRIFKREYLTGFAESVQLNTTGNPLPPIPTPTPIPTPRPEPSPLPEPTPLPPDTFESGVNRPGADFFSFDVIPLPIAKLCQKACRINRLCKAWTYVAPMGGNKAKCWLKSSVPAPVPNGNCTSGIVYRY
ncbi:MAG: hypothetical protein HQK50_00010 [Oligoflexia bacterium]|nr:hypothetical protein [Oligoflexia bacterium]MBF0363917.1 hypothetical protein [Oligoflexia bacterium]